MASQNTFSVQQQYLSIAQVGQHNSNNALLIEILIGNCMRWLQAGYSNSGIYTISPDEQTPFEVSNR